MTIKRTWVAVLATCTVLGVTACGAAGGGTSGSGAGLSSETKEAVEAAFEGNAGTPPSDSPAPEPGRNVWLVTISAQYFDFEAPGQMVDIGDRIGWDVTVFDGQFNPDTVVTGLRQAVADQADAVVVFGVDCVIAKAGFDDVVDAGIPIVGFQVFDCDQGVDDDGAVIETGEQGVFDAVVTYNNPDDPEKPLTYAEMYGGVYATQQALGIINGTDGAAKLIKLKQTDAPTYLAVDHGFDEALETYCSDCEVVETVELTGADLGSALQDKVAQALARHPEANAVFALYDAAALNVAPAVMATGRKDDIFVMAGEGSAPVVDLVEEGRGVNAGVVYPFQWESWAALDAVNRLLEGDEPDGIGFPSGIGTQLYDADRNLPDTDASYLGPVDYASAYAETWGIEAN